MEENMKDPASGTVLPVKTFETPQQLLEVNALNIRYLSDVSVIENAVWDTMVSLDIYVGDLKPNVAGEIIKPERIAIERWQEAVFAALKHGTTATKGVFIRTVGLANRGVWHPERGYVTWQNLEGLSFKNIPSEAYEHKNLTLLIQCFFN